MYICEGLNKGLPSTIDIYTLAYPKVIRSIQTGFSLQQELYHAYLIT